MKKINILCIDDSKAVHAFLRQCLEPITLLWESVYNGEEALIRLQNNIDPFDLIFLDWEMPFIDGPATYSEFKKRGVQTPVFMLTSKNNPEEIANMLEEGVSEYILKPFTQDIILGKIQLTLG